MLDHAAALKIAEELLEQETGPYDPELSIDYERVREKDGIFIAPFNSVEYLETRDPLDMVPDCWPILVDLKSGKARLGTLDDRPFWRES
ncbi:immunity protein 35 of polymorphic toxin system [Streptomyces sp. 2333.5]|uniref:YrhB domain-containing protein n=1 Tax=Streptomyces TaxID=1883 RepID=UPI00089CA5A3|nr:MULTISPECIES: YrhB domain-containing protein [unclassified Streptomyces]PJJ03494.1 immunity protein 35 of polymorphic toxin system [Streptomyces sp. 2333.5]SED37764.1 Immunity protein 35 [Streptomyces sp. 2314.4]SEE47737.1 Immunity protein 35 [Streptomyces sp. 2112.2]